MRPMDRWMRFADGAGEPQRVVAEPAVDGERLRVTAGDGEPVEIRLPAAGIARFVARRAGRRHRVLAVRVGRTVEVAVDGERFAVEPAPPAAAGAGGRRGGPVRAPMPGKVVQCPVAVGDRVEPRQTVIVIEAMKLRTSLTAGVAGRVRALGAAVGDQVAAGDVLVDVEEEEDDG